MAELKGVAENPAVAAQRSETVEEFSRRGPTRADFLRMLFRTLEEQAIRYCVLHSYEGLPDELPSDLDLAVHPQDVKKLPLVFGALCEQGYRPDQCLNYAARGYYFVFFWFEGQVLKSMAVDIIYEHRQSGLVLASGESLVAGRRKRGDFWIPDASTEFAYLLAKKTLKGAVTGRQEQRLSSLVGELGRHQAEKVAGDLFGKRWAAQVVEACVSGSLPGRLGNLSASLWWMPLARDPLNPVRYLRADAVRLIRRWIRPTGLLVAVLGPDGVGKSTLIEHLVQSVGPAFRHHRIFHWRPALLWRKESVRPVIHPHRQPPRSPWSSAAKLFAFLLDYWLAYLLLIRPLLVRSGLIVFDRYFYDVLADPKRYRYGGPLWLARALSSLTPKPDLLLILDAPEKVILSRKEEVAPEEVRRQRQTYLRRATDSSSAIVIDASRSLLEANGDASRAIMGQLARRSQRRHASWLALLENQPHWSGLEWPIRDVPRGDVLKEALNRFIGLTPGKDLKVECNTSPVTRSAISSVVSRVKSKGIGTELPQQGRASTNCFAVLPSRESPRWLLPLGDAQRTLQGFQIYTPYALAARIMKDLLVRVTKTGWQGWARHQVVIASREPLALEGLIRDLTGENRPVFALSLGAPGRHRKLIVQVMRPDGGILGYMKLPLTEAATERVRREADVLARLWSSVDLRPHIPKILYAGKWEDGYILFQSRGPSHRGPVEFGPMHEKFLRALWSLHRVEKSGRSLVEEVAAHWRKSELILNPRWRQLGERALERATRDLAAEMIPCGVSHGDFVPWNTRRQNGCLFVFDWESASWDAPLLSDIFHFQTQVATVLGGPQRVSSNWAPSPSADPRARQALFLLFMLDSACSVAKEGSGNQSREIGRASCRERV